MSCLASRTIDVTFTLVTPAYAGGADAGTTDGLRPPTLKALLRFWWRTMKPHLSPRALFDAEEQIFGSTRKGQGLRVVPLGKHGGHNTEDKNYSFRDKVPLYYMAYGAGTQRIRAGQEFAFRLIAPPALSEEQWSEVRIAAWLLSAFGGFGSRSRRGWGSLRVSTKFDSSLQDPHTADNLSAVLSHGLQHIFGKHQLPSSEPEHTAFSNSARIFVGKSFNSWDKALEKASGDFYSYRKKLGAEHKHAPGDVGPDHKKRAGWLDRPPSSTDTMPLGSAFGLPHNARFSPRGRGPRGSNPRNRSPQVNVGVGANLTGRRASPLFFKVVGDGQQFAPVILWLPSLFLPQSLSPYVKIIKENSKPKSQAIKYNDDKGIKYFLDGSDTDNLEWTGLAEKSWQEVNWR